jgi:GTP-binding protein
MACHAVKRTTTQATIDNDNFLRNIQCRLCHQCGASSAINYLTGQRKLARTSKTPGRTQLINFFQLADTLRLVDLPGYGYAKVPIATRQGWHRSIDEYLRNRSSLAGLVLVMDIRHPLKVFDQQVVHWAGETDVPLHIVLTKCDKLSRGAQTTVLNTVKKQLPSQISVQVLSSTHDIGRDPLIARLTAWLCAP